MFVLFSIAMVCFFALFGMMLVLLRQAKAEGARERHHAERISREARLAPSNTHAQFGVSQSGLDLTLSNLVPQKQPDWRFMVRESGRSAGAPDPLSRRPPTSQKYGALRADRAYFNQDLGDLSDPQAPQSNMQRRA